MRIGLLVDSTCDLPRAFFERGEVELLPISLRVGNDIVVDRRDEAETVAFHRAAADRRADADVESMPFSAEAIASLFLERLVLEYDHVFLLTLTASRSQIHDHALEAGTVIAARQREVRTAAGLTPRFTLSVQSSRTLFTGTAVLAAELRRLIDAGCLPSEIEQRLLAHVPHTYTYLVPSDLHHVYRRASRRGDRSLGWAGYTLGSILDVKPILRGHMDQTGPVAKLRHFEPAVETLFANVRRAVRAGLRVPLVCVGYGGDPAEVEGLPGFAALRRTCEDRDVTLHVAPMSMAGAVHTGPGCVSAAFVSDQHRFEERVR